MIDVNVVYIWRKCLLKMINNPNEPDDHISDNENENSSTGGYWSFSSDYKLSVKRKSRLGRRNLQTSKGSDDSGLESSKCLTHPVTPQRTTPALKDIVNIIPSDNDIDVIRRVLNSSFISSEESGSSSADSDVRVTDCSAVTDRSVSLYDTMPFRTPAKSFFLDDIDHQPFNPLAGIIDSPVTTNMKTPPRTNLFSRDVSLAEPTQFYSPIKVEIELKRESNEKGDSDTKSSCFGNFDKTVVQPAVGALSQNKLTQNVLTTTTVNDLAVVACTPEPKVTPSPQLAAALKCSPLLDQPLMPKHLDRIDVRPALDSFLSYDSRKLKPLKKSLAVEPKKPAMDAPKNGLPWPSLLPINANNTLFNKASAATLTHGLTAGGVIKSNSSNELAFTPLATSLEVTSSTTVNREFLQKTSTEQPSILLNHASEGLKIKTEPHPFINSCLSAKRHDNSGVTEPRQFQHILNKPAESSESIYQNRPMVRPQNRLSSPPHHTYLDTTPNPAKQNAESIKPVLPGRTTKIETSLQVFSNIPLSSNGKSTSTSVDKSSLTPTSHVQLSAEHNASKAPVVQVSQVSVPPTNSVFRTPLTPAPRLVPVQPMTSVPCPPPVQPISSQIPPVLQDPRQPQDIFVNGIPYTAISMLGQGGSSVVYQVIDPKSSKLLAIKCVDLKSVDEPIANGYLNEVQLLSKLQSCQSVIKMFDHQYISQHKLLYVVMEKGDIDLGRLIKDIMKTKKISMSMVIYYWMEMLNAVKDIHDRGIIHSDLKPSNFLLVAGRLKLIDFGIASSLQGDTTSVVKDVMCGTFNYMSPEAISSTNDNRRSHKISYKSDVWSLGCILYNLVYGRTPYSHLSNMWMKLSSIADPSCPVSYPSEECFSNSEIPVGVSVALRWSLNKSVKERPTVQQLLDLPYYTPPSTLLLASKIKSDTYACIMNMFPECNVHLDIKQT